VEAADTRPDIRLGKCIIASSYVASMAGWWGKSRKMHASQAMKRVRVEGSEAAGCIGQHEAVTGNRKP